MEICTAGLFACQILSGPRLEDPSSYEIQGGQWARSPDDDQFAARRGAAPAAELLTEAPPFPRLQCCGSPQLKALNTEGTSFFHSGSMFFEDLLRSHWLGPAIVVRVLLYRLACLERHRSLAWCGLLELCSHPENYGNWRRWRSIVPFGPIGCRYAGRHERRSGEARHANRHRVRLGYGIADVGIGAASRPTSRSSFFGDGNIQPPSRFPVKQSCAGDGLPGKPRSPAAAGKGRFRGPEAVNIHLPNAPYLSAYRDQFRLKFSDVALRNLRSPSV
jgi:hypothetical protein